MKSKKKLYSLLAVALLLLVGVLSACSGEKVSGKKDKSVSTDSTAEGTDNPSAGMPDKFDPVVELSTVTGNGPSVQLPKGDTPDDNAWTRHLENEFGIKVKNEWNAPGEQYDQKINLAINSGDIPDFFMVSPQQFVQLAEADLIEDLTDVYEKYAPENVKNVMDEAGEAVLKAGTIDGKLMSIPFSGKEQENASILWIRKDWMEKLNLSAPKTMDDVLNIAEAFTTKDPDGNGKDDTYGLAVNKEIMLTRGLFNGFHAYHDIWIKDDSRNLVYSNIQPEFKKTLEALQDMYKKGQIDPEFGVKDSAKVAEDYGKNKIGMAFGGRSAVGFKLQTPEAEWQAYPVPSIDDKPTLLQHNVNIEGNRYWVVKKGVEHPEAVLKMMDFFLETFYYNTDDDVFKEFVDDGENQSIWQFSPAKLYTPFNNVAIYKAISKVMESGDENLDDLTPHQRNFYERIKLYLDGDMQWWDQYQGFGPEGSGPVLEQYIDNDQFMMNEFYAAPTKTMAKRGANLEKMELEMMTDIIKGGSLDKFDEYVDNWKKLGGDQITEEINEWYKQQGN
ncbi:extracellular solute-binding protein [Lederbergia sp. NSJ-179]|uniref:extracellular solute-binding protein n=1 Tax=Lederbergia sp. NSJ-179 TaxID=2931402 RepID=UPI001FD45CC5|nr:extracellular solute-binding protein [Lederbergia sp. NSJ-179]MCJ7841221.1 extracellular solute-binding protein [Lederbergia sp. NSJ-179]